MHGHSLGDAREQKKLHEKRKAWGQEAWSYMATAEDERKAEREREREKGKDKG